MPLYEYECPRTGKRFEVIQKFSDPLLTECEDCDLHAECAGEVRKLLSAPAIQFKGSGWYVNDYGKGGQRPKKEGKEGESKPADKAKKKTDSKSSESTSKSSSGDA